MSPPAEPPMQRLRRTVALPTVLSLILALILGVAAFALSGVSFHSGSRARSIQVIDSDNYFPADDIAHVVEHIAWGRPVDFLLYVGELPYQDKPNYWLGPPSSRASAIESIAPNYWDVLSYPKDGSFIVWIDPVFERATTSSGLRTYFDDRQIKPIEDALSARLAIGHISLETLGAHLQRIADIESDSIVLTWRQRVLIGLVVTLSVFPLSFLGLSAWQRHRRNRLAAGPYGRLTRSQRVALMREAERIYSRCSTSLDDLELTVVTAPETSYSDTLTSRLHAWQDHYIGLAREMFEAAAFTPTQLSSLAEAGRLYRINRWAQIVDRGRTALVNEVEALANPALAADLISPMSPDFTAGVDAAHNLRRAVADQTPLLDEHIAEWESSIIPQAEYRSAEEVAGQLARWDALASAMGRQADRALALYHSANGQEFSERHLIEDPARIRCLSRVTVLDNVEVPLHQSEPYTSKDSVLKRTQETKRTEHANRHLPLRLTPLTVALATVFALICGTIVTFVETPVRDVLLDRPQPYLEAPPELTNLTKPGIQPLAELSGTDDESLVAPSSVTLTDHAELLMHPDTLVERLKQLGYPHPYDLVIVTSRSELSPHPKRADEFDLTPLTTEFPTVFEPTNYGDFASPQEDNQLVLWFACDGQCSGIVYGNERTMSPNNPGEMSYGEVERILAAHTRHGNVDIAVWNTAVTFAHYVRAVTEPAPESTSVTGWTSVRIGLMSGFFAFGLLLVVLTIISYPLRRLRLQRQWNAEAQRTLSSLLNGVDALTLELNFTAQTHPAYASALATRWRNLQRSYDAAFERTRNGLDDSFSCAEESVTITRFLRAQTRSLWRVRNLLDQNNDWAQAWDDETTAVYVCQDAAEQAAHVGSLTRQLVSGQISPATALLALDDLAAANPLTAAVRSLSERSAHFVYDSKALATRGVLALDETDAQEHRPQDADYHISLTQAVPRWFKRLMQDEKSQRRWKNLLSGTIILATFIVAFIAKPPQSETIHLILDLPARPVMTIVVDDSAELFDDGAVAAAAQSATLAFQGQLLIMSSHQYDLDKYNPIPALESHPTFFPPDFARDPHPDVRPNSIIILVNENGFGVHVPSGLHENFPAVKNYCEHSGTTVTSEERTDALIQFLTRHQPLAHVEYTVPREDADSLSAVTLRRLTDE